MQEDEIGTRLSSGSAYLYDFLIEACRAVLGRFHRNQHIVSRERVQGYFEGRARDLIDNSANDVVAVASRPYQLLLGADQIVDEVSGLNDRSVVLDFGSGAGAFLRFLRRRGFAGKYVGYDFNRNTSDELSARFNDPMASFTSRLDGTVAANFIFLCNVLVYNQLDDTVGILEQISGASVSDAKLVVVEPYPKWYWEFRFDGLCLLPRRPAEVEDLIRCHGWSKTASVDVSLFRVFGRSIFPIAYAIVAGRT
jgi:SAM-dependent methyltransferase